MRQRPRSTAGWQKLHTHFLAERQHVERARLKTRDTVLNRNDDPVSLSSQLVQGPRRQGVGAKKAHASIPTHTPGTRIATTPPKENITNGNTNLLLLKSLYCRRLQHDGVVRSDAEGYPEDNELHPLRRVRVKQENRARTRRAGRCSVCLQS